MKNRIFYFRELCAGQSRHWMFFVLIYAFLISHDCPIYIRDIISWIILGFVPLLHYVIRDSIDSFWISALIHLGTLASVFLFPVSSTQITYLYLLVMLYYTLSSMILNVGSTVKMLRTVPVYGIFIAIMVVAVFSSIQENVTSFFPYCISLVLSILFYFISYYIDRFLYFTTVNDGTSSTMPRNRIFHTGMTTTVIYMLLGSIIPIIISFWTLPAGIYKNLWKNIRDFIGKILRSFFSFLPEYQPGNIETEVAEETITNIVDPLEGKTAIVWSVLERIAMIFFRIALTALLFYLLYKIYLLLKKLTTLKKMEEEEISEDVHETLQRKPMSKTILQPEPFLSVNAKIRRMLKQKMLTEFSDYRSLPFTTAREYALQNHNSEIADIYEKARYSQIPCNKEDLQRMRVACRRKRS